VRPPQFNGFMSGSHFAAVPLPGGLEEQDPSALVQGGKPLTGVNDNLGDGMPSDPMVMPVYTPPVEPVLPDLGPEVTPIEFQNLLWKRGVKDVAEATSPPQGMPGDTDGG